MALKLSVTTNYGVLAEYWRIMPTMVVNFGCTGITKSVNATMKCWINKQARDDGKDPIEGLDEIITLEGNDAIVALSTGDPRSAIYAVLKAKDKFAKAEDC